MNSSTLKMLIAQYDKTRRLHEEDAERRKNDLYKDYPELEQIDKQLSNLAIQTTKSLINCNDKNLLENLNQNIEDLKAKKTAFLKSIGKSEDYLLPIYNCKNCKDTGYTFNNTRFTNVFLFKTKAL